MAAARARQLGLFGDEPPRRGRPVEPAPVDDDTRARASRLPQTLRMGTSSWSFPGWEGIVYGRRVSSARLAHGGLAAYGRHPLLRAVGIDRSYYGPVDEQTFASYAECVPEDFRFLVKAPESSTLARFPRHPRYGARAGEANPEFLQAAPVSDLAVAPCVAGLAARAGPFLFQFPPQDPDAPGGAASFASGLHGFLDALPKGPQYAVEIRNPEWLTRDYADALAAAGASHCLTVHPRMPSLQRQVEIAAPALTGPLVVRWMLATGLRYEEARDRWQPFDRIVAEDRRARSAIAELCLAAAAEGRESLVVINNKAEGSAPLSVARLADEIDAGASAR